MFLNKDIHIKAIEGGFNLGITPSAMVYGHPNRCGWEKFRVIGKSENDVMLRGGSGYFLCIDKNGRVFGSRSTNDAHFKFIKAEGGFKLQNIKNNKFVTLSKESTYACFYKHCNYGGWQKCLRPGRYSWVGSAGIPNDDMSSAKVGFGLTVTVYEHGGFRGRRWTLPAGQNISCFVPNGWNDKVSSIIVDNKSGAVDVTSSGGGTTFEITEPDQLSVSTFDNSDANYCGLQKYNIGNSGMYSSKPLDIEWIRDKSLLTATDDPKNGLILSIHRTNRYGSKMGMIKKMITMDEINYNWRGGNILDSGLKDNVYLDFSGYIKVPSSAQYVFRTQSDDGVRFMFNGKYIIDRWRLQGPTYTSSRPVQLKGGKYYPIQLTWYEHYGGAVLKLEWKKYGSREPYKPVPVAFLYQNRKLGPGKILVYKDETEKKEAVAKDEPITEQNCLQKAVAQFGDKVTARRSKLIKGSWPQVPTGCSVQSKGDFAAHFNRNPNPTKSRQVGSSDVYDDLVYKGTQYTKVKSDDSMEYMKEVGPYRDTSNRAFRHGPKAYGYNQETCKEACKDHKYFALQNNGWCSCEDDLAHATKYGAYRCGPMGGGWCNYIYEPTKGKRSDWKCVKDSKGAINVPLKMIDGNVACLSKDGRNCMWNQGHCTPEGKRTNKPVQIMEEKDLKVNTLRNVNDGTRSDAVLPWFSKPIPTDTDLSDLKVNLTWKDQGWGNRKGRVMARLNQEKKIANEGGAMDLTKATNIKYGARGKFTNKTVGPGRVGCNNGVFGDPYRGVRKACYVKDGDKETTGWKDMFGIAEHRYKTVSGNLPAGVAKTVTEPTNLELGYVVGGGGGHRLYINKASVTKKQTMPSTVRPLTCGNNHRRNWGGSGYENPNHWCARGKKVLDVDDYGALWISKGQTQQLNVDFKKQLGGGVASMPNGTYINYNKIPSKTEQIELPFNLNTWSGGWKARNCPQSGRYGFFGVVVNGKMLIGKKVERASQTNCDETIKGNRQKDYRGCQNKTISGRVCQPWSSNSPHNKSATNKRAYAQKKDGVGNHNFCRNPDNEPNGIWCYTTDRRKRWEYCDPIRANSGTDNDPQEGKGDNCLNCKPPSRGFNVVALSEAGVLVSHATFDTHGDSYASGKLIAELKKQIEEGKKDGRLLIIGVHDEAVSKLSGDAKVMIGDLGARQIHDLRFRGSYLAVYHPKSEALIYEGLDNCGNVKYTYECGYKCTPLYNENFYKGKYTDLSDKQGDELFKHWSTVGLKTGRRASEVFDAPTYGSLYDDLSKIKKDNVALAGHFMNYGLAEGRIGALDESKGFYGLVTNGLQCYLDARNPKSLTNGSKQWKDLTGKGNHFNFSKRIISDGLRADMSSCGTGKCANDVNQLSIGKTFNGGSYTIIMNVRVKKPSRGYAFMIRQKNKQRGISSHITWDDGFVYFDNMGYATTHVNRQRHRMGWGFDKNSSVEDHMYVFTRTPTGGLDIYVDGILKVKGHRGRATVPDLIGNMTIGYNGWHADMQTLLIYNMGMPSVIIKRIHNWFLKTNDIYRNALLDEQQKDSEKLLPKLPVRGLVLAVDAGDRRSFNNSPKVRDLSGQENHLTFTKIPVVKDGAWVCKGDRGLKLSGPPGSSLGINGYSDYTIVLRFKVQQSNGNILFRMKSHGGSNSRYSDLILTPWKDGSIHWYHNTSARASSYDKLQYPSKHLLGKMVTFVAVQDKGHRKFYVNGELMRDIPRNKVRAPSLSLGGGTRAPLAISSDPVMFIMGGDEPFEGEVSHIMLYRTAITQSDIDKLVRYMNNPYIIKDTTWENALAQCSKAGGVVCDIDNVCFNKKPIDTPKVRNALAPLSSDSNTWVNLDTCRTQVKTGVVKKAHIKCCPIERTNPYFTAACNHKDRVYFFKGSYVQVYKIDGKIHESIKIEKIDKIFPGIPDSFNSDIDSAGITDRGLLYLFKDMLGMIYDTINKKVVKHPGKIDQLLAESAAKIERLPMDFRGYYDTILTLGDRLVLFKGPTAYFYGRRFDLKKLIPGHVMNTGVDAWMHLDNGERVVAREGYLYHWNTRKMMPLLDYFYDLRPPFVSVDERCRKIADNITMYKALQSENRGTNDALYAKYTKLLRKLGTEQRNLCEHKSLYEYKKDVREREERIENLKKSIIDFQGKQTDSVAKGKEYTRRVAQNAKLISGLDNDLAIEKRKKCPVDATCIPENRFGEGLQYNTCKPHMIEQVLREGGFTKEQLEQLKPIIGTEVSADDFDIRTHKDFHKYTNKDLVKACPADISELSVDKKLAEVTGEDIDVGETDFKSLLRTLQGTGASKDAACSIRALQNKKMLASMTTEMEEKAFNIIKDSVLKYHMDYIKKNIPDGTDGKADAVGTVTVLPNGTKRYEDGTEVTPPTPGNPSGKVILPNGVTLVGFEAKQWIELKEKESAATMAELSEATKKMVCDLKVDNKVANHFKLLKEIQVLLNKTHRHPNYRKIAGKITKLENQLKQEEQALKIAKSKGYREHVADLESRVMATRQSLGYMTEKLKKLHTKNSKKRSTTATVKTAKINNAAAQAQVAASAKLAEQQKVQSIVNEAAQANTIESFMSAITRK